MTTDFTWGNAHMPGEVTSVSEGWPSISSLGEVGVLTGQGWPSTFTSSTCRPTPPSGSARTGLDAHRPASVLREAEDSAPSAGVGTGAGLPVAAPVLLSRLRGAW